MRGQLARPVPRGAQVSNDLRLLDLGKNVLWVAKQHGHSIITMLRIYAVWTEGAGEADVQAIERAMRLTAPRGRYRKDRCGGRYAVDVRASTDFLAAIQSVPTTIQKLRQMAFPARDARVPPLTSCSERKNRAEPCRQEGGWGGRIRTSEWRDQNPKKG
jgi:hypothetical protein